LLDRSVCGLLKGDMVFIVFHGLSESSQTSAVSHEKKKKLEASKKMGKQWVRMKGSGYYL